MQEASVVLSLFLYVNHHFLALDNDALVKSFSHKGNRSGRLFDSLLPISCGYILPLELLYSNIVGKCLT